MSRWKNYLFSNFYYPVSKLLPYIKPYWKTYLSLMLFLFIDIFITFLMAWLLKNVTDAAIDREFQLLKDFLMLGLFILLLVSLFTFVRTYVSAYAINGVRKDLKIALFDRTLRTPSSQIMKYHSGELLSRLTNDINSTAGLIGVNLMDLIRFPFMTMAVFVYLASMNWKLTLATLCVAPILLVSGAAFGLIMKKNNKLMHENYAKVNSFLNDVFGGYTVIRSFALERLMHKKYSNYSNELLSLEMKDTKLFGIMQAGTAAVGMIAYFINLGFGSYLVATGALSIGSLLAFLTLMQYLVYPFTGMASSWSQFQRSVAAFERVWEIMCSPPEWKNMPIPSRSILPSLSVETKNLSFTYEGTFHAIEKLNLFIPAGKVIAIVGPSGAGKSTLLKLLLGLYRSSEGTILYNNQPIDQLDPTELRSLISYVPQETYLFDGTIRENLLHGYPEATEFELIKAAKEAQIHDFIMSLPDQYAAEIGERGVNLSGGQKQRISIARAILKKSPLLLLDEATSSLDNENEYAVQESLKSLMKGRTTIVIAHRLSTIQEADWILVMDKGKLVAQGTHQSLVMEDNPYSRMYRLQFRSISQV
ncbi:ABC transporter ATP-binding protein [Ammoniphilus sp. YIM 78166]|uniref:ABC transporter ATP-binding protein n=1 Tax=Ammoniphilus sp. YIM 78166 TaxID=1644106 RepID=UPI00142FAD7B|nr:ABC transporter ATP-binding protein [Ammoniphilus sp. YIM 78166]